ncbi:MAG: molybdopterin-guanine dinucleotide biosynthesis protein A [Crocinitomicaceae bacterium]|jgi:molybdopterin-guanine dinucleotide biosynthesis protein A
MRVTGIILAGGKSTRMGSDKGLVEFKGIPMIQHIIAEFKQLNLPIIIVANNEAYSKFGVRLVTDLIKDKGPVGGIYTALTVSDTDVNVIVSCDVPFVKKELIVTLLNESKESEVTISSFEGREHPLIGVYKKSIVDVFKSNLDSNQLKLREVIKEVKTKVVEFSEPGMLVNAGSFNNINTKKELKELEA